jgi:hypothetical protein
VEEKFRGNCRYGGWSDARANEFLALAKTLFGPTPVDLSAFRG